VGSKRHRPAFGAGERAQTLVEVLVATVVLGIGLAAILNGFSACLNAVSVLRGQSVARDFCATAVSQLRTNPSLLSSDEEGSLGDDHPGFKWRREVRETPEQGLLAVRITVEWTSQGVARDYVLETLVATPRM
jgi:type II secretion system protein I